MKPEILDVARNVFMVVNLPKKHVSLECHFYMSLEKQPFLA